MPFGFPYPPFTQQKKEIKQKLPYTPEEFATYGNAAKWLRGGVKNSEQVMQMLNDLEYGASDITGNLVKAGISKEQIKNIIWNIIEKESSFVPYINGKPRSNDEKTAFGIGQQKEIAFADAVQWAGTEDRFKRMFGEYKDFKNVPYEDYRKATDSPLHSSYLTLYLLDNTIRYLKSVGLPPTEQNIMVMYNQGPENVEDAVNRSKALKEDPTANYWRHLSDEGRNYGGFSFNGQKLSPGEQQEIQNTIDKNSALFSTELEASTKASQEEISNIINKSNEKINTLSSQYSTSLKDIRLAQDKYFKDIEEQDKKQKQTQGLLSFIKEMNGSTQVSPVKKSSASPEESKWKYESPNYLKFINR